MRGKTVLDSMHDLQISRKISIAFAGVCLLCALLGSAAVWGFYRVNAHVQDISLNAIPSMKALEDIRYSVATIRRTDALLLLCRDEACRTRLTTKRINYLKTFNEAMSIYVPLVNTEKERALLRTIEESSTNYINLSNQARKLAEAGQNDEAAALLLKGKAVEEYNTVSDTVEKDVALNVQQSQQDSNDAYSLGSRMFWVSTGMLILVVSLCIIVGVALVKLIVPRLLAATHALEQMARKDLRIHVEAGNQDEIGRLAAAINTSAESMHEVLRTLMQSADTLSAAAAELDSRSSETHDNAQEQTDKSNQIAAAAAQMTATIGEISQNAEMAALSSRESAGTASQGGEAMEEAASTMERIAASTGSVSEKMHALTQSTQEIGKIISVIQEISEQTNLLALNAAIEAARAGEHGRGFAVVAGEVRRLAERTKGATKEISSTIHSIQEETSLTREMMTESQSEVESGLEKTFRVRSSLESIVSGSKQVEHQIHLIATAATEQAASSREISESTSHIASLASRNSNATEETAEACKELAELATRLDGMIRQFQLNDEPHGSNAFRK